jgi:trigger factor
MNVSVIAKSEVSRTLKIEVPAETVAAEYEKAFSRAAKGVSLPGFRKGKVPRQILEPQISGSVNQELLESLLPQATFDAVKQEALKAVGRPKIEDLKFEGKGPISFQAVIEVKPEVKLGKVEGLAVSGPDDAVSDKDVDEQVQALRQRGAKEGGLKDGPAALGDSLKVDFQGFVDGQPFQGGNATDFSLVLGRQQLIPGFEEQLVGAKAGETRQVKVSFPADYPAQDLAGKAGEFTVSVKEVRLMELPALDDAWAKTFGEEVTGLDFLRARLREALQTQKSELRRRVLMDRAAEELLKGHSFAVPETLIEAEAHALEQVEMRNMAQRGVELSGEDARAALHKALRAPAEKRARLSLVLECIAEIQSVTVDDADFDAEMARFARQLGTSPAEAARWARSQGREDGIRAQIRERKALEWVLGKAKVTTAA